MYLPETEVGTSTVNHYEMTALIDRFIFSESDMFCSLSSVGIWWNMSNYDLLHKNIM